MKKLTIKNLPINVWAAINKAGELWGIDRTGQSRKAFTQMYFNGRYEADFKPHGWRVVRVRITPTKGQA